MGTEMFGLPVNKLIGTDPNLLACALPELSDAALATFGDSPLWPKESSKLMVKHKKSSNFLIIKMLKSLIILFKIYFKL